MRPILTPLAQSLPPPCRSPDPKRWSGAPASPFARAVGANESEFGPSPKVIAAMAAAAPEAWKYGDPELFELKAALGAHLGVPAANVAVGEGIDGLHRLIARLIIGPGDVAVTSLGAYPTLNYHVTGFGGRVVAVPYAQIARISTGCSRRRGASRPR